MALDPGYVTIIAQRLGLKIWPSFLERVTCTKKEVFLNGGWRGGKSHSGAFIVFLAIYLIWLRTPIPRDAKGNPLGAHLIWLVGPEYDQANEEFRYIMQWALGLGGLAVEYHTPMSGSRHMTISYPGHPGIVEVVTKSANDPTSLGSVAPVIMLACECGLMSAEAKEWLEGRVSEKNATLLWSGTFHNDEGKAQYDWYEQISARVKEFPTDRSEVFNLPSWENEYLFGNCLEGENSILKDPTLASWCPDDNHGEAHKAMLHPMMRLRHAAFADRPRDWEKRYGGIPTGVRDPIYEWSLRDSLTDFDNNRYLIPMPDVMSKRDYWWLRKTGGMDFGFGKSRPGGHPSSACITKLTKDTPTRDGDTWAVACPMDDSGRNDWIFDIQKVLSKIHGVPLDKHHWYHDPMIKFVPDDFKSAPVSDTMWSRESRVALVNSLAMSRHLFFDANNPEIVVLFSQIQRLHWKRKANDSWGYDRVEDDAVAAFEDAIARLHQGPGLQLPKRWPLGKPRSPSYTEPMRSVS